MVCVPRPRSCCRTELRRSAEPQVNARTLDLSHTSNACCQAKGALLDSCSARHEQSWGRAASAVGVGKAKMRTACTGKSVSPCRHRAPRGTNAPSCNWVRSPTTCDTAGNCFWALAIARCCRFAVSGRFRRTPKGCCVARTAEHASALRDSSRRLAYQDGVAHLRRRGSLLLLRSHRARSLAW